MSDDRFDPAEARWLLGAQERTVRQALDVRLPEQLASWGLAWFVGLGAIWLQVRGQQPYVGPGPAAAIVFAALLALVGVVTGRLTWSATSGIGGNAGRQGSLYGAGWGLGFAALWGLLGALGNAGATPGVLGILGVTGALLVVGLMYLFGAALWGVRPMGALGCWLLVLAAGVGFAGPVTASLAGSVLGGGAFLATAAWLRAVRSRCPR